MRSPIDRTAAWIGLDVDRTQLPMNLICLLIAGKHQWRRIAFAIRFPT